MVIIRNTKKVIALAFILLLITGSVLTGCSTPAPVATPGETPGQAAQQQPAEPIVPETPAVTGSTTDTQAEETSDRILKDLNPQQAFDLIQENRDNADFVILDVRTPEEYAEGHIENAINIDFYADTFREDLDKLDKDKRYLIYCRSGARSGNTLIIMGELNFNEVYNILGGIRDWLAGGFEVVKEAEEPQAIAEPEAGEESQHVEGALEWTEVNLPSPSN